jgi:hypothetical protein
MILDTRIISRKEESLLQPVRLLFSIIGYIYNIP